MMLNPVLTAEQGAIRDLARKFAESEVAPKARRIDEASEFDWDLHRRLAALRLLGMTVPLEHGGVGADTYSWCLAVEEVTKVSSSVANGITLTDSMLHYLITHGTDEQKR